MRIQTQMAAMENQNKWQNWNMFQEVRPRRPVNRSQVEYDVREDSHTGSKFLPSAIGWKVVFSEMGKTVREVCLGA